MAPYSLTFCSCIDLRGSTSTSRRKCGFNRRGIVITSPSVFLSSVQFQRESPVDTVARYSRVHTVPVGRRVRKSSLECLASMRVGQSLSFFWSSFLFRFYAFPASFSAGQLPSHVDLPIPCICVPIPSLAHLWESAVLFISSYILIDACSYQCCNRRHCCA